MLSVILRKEYYPFLHKFINKFRRQRLNFRIEIKNFDNQKHICFYSIKTNLFENTFTS